jgi:cobalt-zinc-cadmium efflux system outer membrane protein
MELAFAQNQELRGAEASVAEAQGRLLEAETYPYNPVLEGGVASRRSGSRNTVDFEVGVGQELEIAGQRGGRIASAEAELLATRARHLRTKRLVAARVHIAFVDALEARELLAVARRDVEIVEGLHHLAQRRLDRGAATQLDVNVAAAELGRAEARLFAVEADHDVARALLAEAVGLGPSVAPVAAGELREDLGSAPSLEELMQTAREHRADLQSLRDLERAGRARHELARLEAWPNLTLRAFLGQEDGSTTIVGGGLAIPIPLFDRNQGRIAETAASIARAQAELNTGELSVAREIVVAHARYRAGVTTALRLRQRVLATLEQNLDLLQRAFDAGKLTWPEVLVIRRAFVDAQRELTAAEAQARRGWIELQIASGKMPVPQTEASTEQQR